MVAKTRLLVDPIDSLSIRKTIKTATAIQHIKAELSGQLEQSVDSSAKRHSDIAPVVKKTKEEALPLIAEIITMADQGHLPIIVVPSAAGNKSRVNILNAEKFLKAGVFEEPNPRTMARPLQLPLIIEKTIAGRQFRFRVFDDTSKFRKLEWKSCVAVFVDGKKWQFSGWPFKTEGDLFYSLRGFFAKYLDEPVDPLLAQWNLTQLNLRREGRHQDASVAAEVWRGLESYLLQPRVRKFSNDHKL